MGNPIPDYITEVLDEIAPTRKLDGLIEFRFGEAEEAESRVIRVMLVPSERPETEAEPQPPQQEWLTTEEAAEYLRKPSRSALYEAVRRGQVPHYRDGRKLLFKRSELDAYMRRNKGYTLPEDTVDLYPKRRPKRG